MDEWCERRNLSRGAVLTLDQTWRLGQAWYAGRADASWRGRTAEEADAILRGVGLTDSFWSLGD